MGKRILIDTNILILAIRGKENYRKEIEDAITYQNGVISVVTYAEIIKGLRKDERQTTLKLLHNLNLQHIDQTISKKFYQLVRGLPQRIFIADRLIAATALMNKYEIFTTNKKDFEDVPGIKLYQPKFVSLKDL